MLCLLGPVEIDINSLKLFIVIIFFDINIYSLLISHLKINEYEYENVFVEYDYHFNKMVYFDLNSFIDSLVVVYTNSYLIYYNYYIQIGC